MKHAMIAIGYWAYCGMCGKHTQHDGVTCRECGG